MEQQHQERELAKQEASPPPVKSLEDQLVQFIRTLSKEQLRHPWTMNEIILAGNLTGKYRDRPHPQQVAEILTRNAWTKRRLYGAEYGGKRYWSPPA
ncbi:MAG: hypothetical protein HON65_06215 [Rhodospirillales bacterium]|nr:hypothetical protein [Rhodospirillales bacterium]